MARPRKLDALTTNISGRIRPEQDVWLRYMAEQRFDGELSRTLRWAIDQAQVFDSILRQSDPVAALDQMLNPYESPDPEEEIAEAEREFEAWKREQAIKRAQRKAKESE
jgi:hypothetical protein